MFDSEELHLLQRKKAKNIMPVDLKIMPVNFLKMLVLVTIVQVCKTGGRRNVYTPYRKNIAMNVS